MSEESIDRALKLLFADNKVVFWYDDNAKLQEQFNDVHMDGVQKISVKNNEFAVKNQIISSNENDKFLIYFPQGEPALKDNWLLDLQLAHRVFNSDQESMFLQDVGLGYHFKELVKQHVVFFENKDRRLKLKELLSEDDVDRDIQYKMMAVMFGVEYPTLEAFIQTYANDFNDGNDKYEKNLERYNLKEIFWKDVSRKFNYNSDTPAIYDFLLDVFGRNFKPTSNNRSAKESRILIALWKDAISYQDAFQSISDKIASDLNINKKLEETSLEEVIEEDIFKAIDLKIIHELIQSLTHESIDKAKLLTILKKRENKYWYLHFKNFYQCLMHAAEMIEEVREVDTLHFGSIEEGAVNYSNELYKIDFHYRKFIYNYRMTNQNSALSALYEKVNKVYSNDWLLTGNDLWQKTVDECEQWPVRSKHSQFNFFNVHVKPYTSKGQRLFVVISDALRYENGWELCKELQAEQRYEAELDYMISGLPSYTQLGMAALLPHEQLNIYPKDCTVLVDGISSMGTAGRTKVLEASSGVRAVAIGAEEFMNFNANTDGRAFVKDFDLIYIYHNHIDDTGDKTTSEVKVFEAVEAEILFLKKLLKQIANVNGNNILITADHGYIYQNDAIDESDFAESGAQGEIWKENRRFVIGSGLTGGAAVKKFVGSQVGLTSDVDLLIPKGINRLRIKGAGSRFVHGGASLQEIVVPMLSVSKKRKDTTKQVEVDVIKSTDKITTNILAVTFIQKGLVSDKVLARSIRAAIKAEDGVLLSDIFSFNFDIEEGAERERAVNHRFQLSAVASGKYKGQRVSLVIEEPVPNSSKWKTYAEHNYTLNISFMNDFDDF
jgi:uncharacterized protein (TIGR02687 family)